MGAIEQRRQALSAARYVSKQAPLALGGWVVLFRNGTKRFLYRFTVPTEMLTQGSRIEFAELRSRYSK